MTFLHFASRHFPTIVAQSGIHYPIRATSGRVTHGDDRG